MKKLLDTQDLRKINILSELSLGLETTNIHNLAKKLDITSKTLLSTIDEINEDHESIQIKKNSFNKLKLEAAPNASIFLIKLKYLKESIPYKILSDIFNNTFQNQNLLQLAESYHISTTTLYRKFPAIKELLNDFDLDFRPLHNPPIKGSEKQIRFFFFQFYWYSNQVFEWPFTGELKKLCLSLYDKIFVNHFEIKSFIMKEKIILWLAINTIRIQLGYKLNFSEVQEINDFVQSDINYIPVKKQFSRYLSYYFYLKSIKFEEWDYALFYMFIICDESTTNNEALSLPLTGSEKNKFEEAVFQFLNKLAQYLGRPLSQKEHDNLYINLLKLSMYTFFFPQKGLFLPLSQRIDYLKRSYSDALANFDHFYHNLYPDEEKFQIFKNNPNLYAKYMLLLIDNLDKRTFYPDIKIALITLEYKNINMFYRKKIQSLTLSTTYFVNEFEEDVDLIISYTLPDLNSDKIHFTLNTPVTPWDWERLKLELQRIQNEKLKRLKQYQEDIF